MAENLAEELILDALGIGSFNNFHSRAFSNIENIEEKLDNIPVGALQHLKNKLKRYKQTNKVKNNLQYVEDAIKRLNEKDEEEQEVLKKSKTKPPVKRTGRFDNIEDEPSDEEGTALLDKIFLEQMKGTRKTPKKSPQMGRKKIKEEPKEEPKEEEGGSEPEEGSEEEKNLGIPQLLSSPVTSTHNVYSEHPNLSSLVEDISASHEPIQTPKETTILSRSLDKDEETPIADQAEVESLEKQEQELLSDEPKGTEEVPSFGKGANSEEVNKQFKEALGKTHTGTEIPKEVQKDIEDLPKPQQSPVRDFLNEYAPPVIETWDEVKKLASDFSKTEVGQTLRKTQLGKQLKKMGVFTDDIVGAIEKGNETNVDEVQDLLEKRGFGKKLAVALTVCIVVAISTHSFLTRKKSKKLLPSFVSSHGKKKKKNKK